MALTNSDTKIPSRFHSELKINSHLRRFFLSLLSSSQPFFDRPSLGNGKEKESGWHRIMNIGLGS